MQEDGKRLLYFAYGEHMNESEMLREFPHARKVGQAKLDGFSLCFVGRDGKARAALEPDPRGSLPGVVWSLHEADADALDKMAGDPNFARREIRFVSVDGMTLPVLVYITVPGQQRGRPGFVTYSILSEAFESIGESPEKLREKAMNRAR